MKDIYEMPEDLLSEIRVIEMIFFKSSELSKIHDFLFLLLRPLERQDEEEEIYWKSKSDGIRPLLVKKHFDARLVLENISNQLLQPRARRSCVACGVLPPPLLAVVCRVIWGS